MLTIKDFDSAKWVLSSGEEFGAPLMSNYIELLEQEADIDFACLRKYLKSFLPFMHGKNHLRIRKSVNKLFTRFAVKKWIPNISEAVDHRLYQLGRHSYLDLIIDILDPFYMDLVEILFGVKLPDREKFISQIEIATNSVERMASISQLLNLQKVLVELDTLVTAQFNTFDSNTLFREVVDHTKDEMSRDEVVVLLLVLLIAPRATTETIAHIVVAFCQLTTEKIKKFSSTTWVEEHISDLIRLYASTNLISREVKKDVEIGGCPISAGSQVLINIPSVNRDQNKYGDQVALEKLNNNVSQRKQLTFGSGSHICLGAELAKEIAKEFIPKFFAKYPHITCDTQKITFYKAQIATRIKTLPVSLI